MNHKTTQKKQQSHTSMKIVSAILCIGIIVSIIVNIYQFNSNDTLKIEIATLQSNIQALETERDTLNKEIESKQTTVSDLSLQIEDLQKKIEQLETDNKSLSDSLKDLEERQKEEAAVKTNTSDTVESDTKVQVSQPSSNGGGGNGSGNGNGGGGGSTTPSGSDGEKLLDALKQLGVDTSKDASQDVAAPAPDWNQNFESGKGIHAE